MSNCARIFTDKSSLIEILDYHFTAVITNLTSYSPSSRTQEIRGGANSKKVNTHSKIPEIDLDFFRLF